MTVDIVCKVVDNLGDIGFVYRLARALSELPDAPSLRLIVDDLASFSAICPGVNPAAGLQTVESWTVARWDDPGADALLLFRSSRPRMVLECYACGRPSWLDAILFDETDPVPRTIVTLEYLTAESWARDFHRLPSLTRSPLVRKAIFMPGFEEGTGGLLEDTGFRDAVAACAGTESRKSLRREALEALGPSPADGEMRVGEDDFWVFVFSYEHDFSSIVGDLKLFHAERPLCALVASGRSSGPFLEAWNRAGRPFPVFALPLLGQRLWDRLLAAADFSIVRGEETFARACLSGRPFLWQCYPFADTRGGQSAEGGQLPKVHAFLDRLKPYLEEGDFGVYERLTLRFNGSERPRYLEPEAGDLLPVLRGSVTGGGGEAGKGANGVNVHSLPSVGGLSAGFGAWSRDVRALGNLAVNLLTFMRDLG